MSLHQTPGGYHGPAGHIHDMSLYENPDPSARVPVESSGQVSTMEDMYSNEAFQNDDTTYQDFVGSLEQIMFEEDGIEDAFFAQPDVNFGPSDRENPIGFSNWLGFEDEESEKSLSYYTPAAGSSNNGYQPPATAAAPPNGQEVSSMYPYEVMVDGRFEPYDRNESSTRATNCEWEESQIETPYYLLNGDMPVSFRPQDNLGHPRAQAINGNHHGLRTQGPVNNFPQRQDMTAGYQTQAWLHPDLRNYKARHMVGPSQSSGAANGSDGPFQRGESQGAVVSSSVVVPDTSVIPKDVVDQNASVDPNNNGFMPLFKDEDSFNKRKAAKELARQQSDYPHGNLPAQHEILKKIYSAFRNTNGVEDSDKVAAKFADNSYSEESYHEACWEVMIHCRDSQELNGLLVPNDHKTKFIEKDTFYERVQSVIDTLHYSKAACKSALAPSFLDRLADQPEVEGKRKASNKKLNKNKTAQNKAGQKAIEKDYADKEGVWKGTPVAESDEADESEGAGDEVAGDEVEPRQGEIEQQQSEVASAGRRKHRREDDEQSTPRKRARH